MSRKIDFTEELKKSYLDYSMSVIVNRAIPDAFDGCKPVQRRILYSMAESGYFWDKSYKKSARVIGDVLGKYHPHGDSAIYDAMVRMAQDFSLSITLIDGQGNFGSIDGDSAASMRYTESRLAKISKYIIQDYDKDTVDMIPNYDNSLEMPSVLPASFPHLLVNGANGIAVGMATSIPTHNLHEVLDATCAFIDNPNITVKELMNYIKGPDLPTGGIISDPASIAKIYQEGRGSIIVRGVASIEDGVIIITEIPYQVNKSRLIEQIVDMSQLEDLQDISTVRDESNCDGIRIVIELKRNANPEIVCKNLYLRTQLQTSLHVYMLALDRGVPKQLGLIDILEIFVKFRDEVIIRRTSYYMRNSKSRAHILWGLALAVSKLDEVIQCIKLSTNNENARHNLMKLTWDKKDILPYINMIGDSSYNGLEHINLSEVQCKSILEMRLQSITGLEQEKILNELNELSSKILDLQSLLDSREKRYDLMKSEMGQIRSEFKSPRRSKIEYLDLDESDLSMIEEEDCVITVSHRGYIKRVPLEVYRTQKRGGRGKQGALQSDPIEHMIVANTHQEILLFSSTGYVYSMFVYKIPSAMPNTVGRAIVNIIQLEKHEKVAAALAVKSDENSTLLFITSKGYVRRNAIKDFEGIRKNGKIAIKLEDGEELSSVMVVSNDDEVMITSSAGKTTRFPVSEVRIFNSRTSRGIRGMTLAKDEIVVSITLVSEDHRKLDSNVLTVTEKGFGKRAKISDYRTTSRGTKGVTTTIVNKDTGPVVGAYQVSEDDEILLMNNKGQIIRCAVNEIRVVSRRTKGVHLVKLNEGDTIVHAFVIKESE
jgi:DNA gyrase subunit A